MDIKKLHSAIERADEALIRDGVPIPARPFRALGLVFPHIRFPVLTREEAARRYPEWAPANVAWKVQDWYIRRYGDKVCISTRVGRVPLTIRGELFFARIPLGYGQPSLSPLECIEDLTDDLRSTLMSHEMKRLVEEWAEAFELVYELDDARHYVGTDKVAPYATELFRRAVADREAAVSCLAEGLDTNGSCFHSQQHAEKMLKFLLAVRAGFSEDALRKLRHGLDKALDACVSACPVMEAVRGEVANVGSVSMDYRYTRPAVPAAEATRVFWAALRVGAQSACAALSLERRRGSVTVNGEAFSVRRRKLISAAWDRIVESHGIAVRAWGPDVAVLVLDLRDDWAYGIASVLKLSVEGIRSKLDAPGNHRLEATVVFGLPRQQAMHHVVVNRLTAMRGFDSRADEKSVMVSVVSDGGYDTMTLPLHERPAP